MTTCRPPSTVGPTRPSPKTPTATLGSRTRRPRASSSGRRSRSPRRLRSSDATPTTAATRMNAPPPAQVAQQARPAHDRAEQDDLLAGGVEPAVVEVDRADGRGRLALGDRR